jgi:uncharacterized protein YbjQ (UPF0145 family)
VADLWFQIVPVVVLLVLGFTVGSWRERQHFRALTRREQELQDIGVVNLKNVRVPETVKSATLVSGDAVIATDYFKGFAAKLRSIVGGEIKSYDTLMQRARREAMLRLLEQARALGATEVWNVRYETSNIRSSSQRNPAVSVEAFAFGTAIVRG